METFCRLTSVCLLIDLHLAKLHTQPSVQKQRREIEEKKKDTQSQHNVTPTE